MSFDYHDCSNLLKTLGDIEEYELQKEIERSQQVLTLNEKLNTAIDFLTYIHSHGLQGNYTNLSITQRNLLMTPFSDASAERTFKKLKTDKN